MTIGLWSPLVLGPGAGSGVPGNAGGGVAGAAVSCGLSTGVFAECKMAASAVMIAAMPVSVAVITAALGFWRFALLVGDAMATTPSALEAFS